MTTDAELLHRYVAQHDERAFAEIVRRHLDLVYAAAHRRAGGRAHLAEEIVQTVGVALSTVILIVAASAASHEFRPKEAVIAGVFLAALAVGVFVVGLKLQLPIWPTFIV